MIELFLAAIIIFLLAVVFFLFKKVISLQQSFNELSFAKQSQSVKYGKLTEQWLPFVKEFPFNPEDFRFVGSPVDGIVFAENSIVFCEFKAGNSKLSERQKKIRVLVKEKLVEWREFSLK